MNYSDLTIKCRSYVAAPGDRIEFQKVRDQEAVWLHAWSGDDKNVAVKVFYEDLRLIAEYCQRVAGVRQTDKVETLREIHAALGKIIG